MKHILFFFWLLITPVWVCAGENSVANRSSLRFQLLSNLTPAEKKQLKIFIEEKYYTAEETRLINVLTKTLKNNGWSVIPNPETADMLLTFSVSRPKNSKKKILFNLSLSRINREEQKLDEESLLAEISGTSSGYNVFYKYVNTLFEQNPDLTDVDCVYECWSSPFMEKTYCQKVQ